MSTQPENWIGEYLTLSNDCKKRDAQLNTWERGFVASILRRIDAAGADLTPRQAKILINIWERVTKNG